ncbi:MAG: hypothetical protein IJZ68_07650 [Bacteroidaceae bacterium]|nr:hypothetical protein [Bacteroidaceae bacterium]
MKTLKLYILKDREQIVTEMEQEAIMQYCEEHGFSMFFFETSFMTNDWNWCVQYPDVLYICAKTMQEARNFILHAYYKSHEYNGDCGVLFRGVRTLYVGG